MMHIRSDRFIKNLGTTYVVVVVLLVLISLLFKKGNDVIFINQNHSPFLDWFFTNATVLGDGKIFIPIILVFLFIKFEYAITGLGIWISHGILCSVLKRIVFSDFGRPISVIDNSLLHFVPGVQVHSAFSFPSGHTATIFCASIILSMIIRNRFASIALLIIALLVAYARVYLLQHFVMDIAAGAFIGTITAFACWELRERWKAIPWMAGRIQIQVRLGDKRQIQTP